MPGHQRMRIAGGRGAEERRPVVSEFTPQRNKAFVLGAFETLFNKKDIVAAEKFGSSTIFNTPRIYRPGETGSSTWLNVSRPR